jgi:hypothetical protein
VTLAVVFVVLLVPVILCVYRFVHRQANWDRGGLMERRGPGS